MRRLVSTSRDATLAERVEAKQPASIELPRAKAGVVLAEVVLAVAEEIPVSLGGIALEPRDGSAGCRFWS